MTSPAPTWTPPTQEQIQELSDALGMPITPELLDVAVHMAEHYTDLYNTTGAWWQETQQPPPAVDYRPGNDVWNATQWRFLLQGEGTGPLSDLTLALKETIRVAGVPLGYGSRLVENHTATESATVVTRAVEAGATITHTGRSDDLGLAITGDQGWHGPVLNPWNTKHLTGGSSAGAAALIASGDADVGILIDDAGSCRVPAAYCGLAALLPTRGYVPMTGIIGFTGVQDRVGFASLRTEQLARVASAVSGGDGRDLKCGPATDPQDWAARLSGDVSRLRIGLVTESLAPELCNPEVAAAVRARAQLLASLGAEVREVSIPRYTWGTNLALILTAQFGIPDYLSSGLGYERTLLSGDPALAEQFYQRRTEHPEWMAKTVQVLGTTAGFSSGKAPGWWASAAMALIPHATKMFTEHLADAECPDSSGVDLLLTPTAPDVAPTVPTPDMSLLDVISRAVGEGITHTAVTNLTGLPAGQAPTEPVNGLPAGIHLTAAPGHEDKILSVLAALEPEGGYPGAV